MKYRNILIAQAEQTLKVIYVKKTTRVIHFPTNLCTSSKEH